ncbi:hypothetical protein LTR91_014193 [Friedmanniomyces endolithicus]|uniref:Phosphatidic acid phosphatase type 2/haloperoxidase domain-containing protein n=2 Tax=Dothideomycetidae TaxID=451867 RepID=A0AAN6KCQ1_9PEZI|nr:hypothetical protein LTR94_009857 [Friedmanniomyces endolithicus]KAK5145704.1 hypothetical protein LTR32_002588 [Rachicladosporium monterosium]KAK0781118.1 hypothetical protein LTR75_014786 [Friedmanniomyces endolithicus]KAK0790884.1 hypothetical protein LTR38_010406 [Friedmanniomyces endolithicus]KAK0810648.1 hypothetical protein LTR59_002159 [Friedmanniomyces endolithicus]
MARPPIALILSYVLDWLVIIVIAAIAGGLNFVKPNHRPFSLLDLDISYPYIGETISTGTLAVVSLIAPAIIILIVVGALVPGPRISRTLSRGQAFQLKLWEFEKGWAGLALAVATAFFITQGSKNLFGKPRPDFLGRCQPDLTNIAAHVVGGLGQDISSRWTLVNSGICTQANTAVLNDGFRSFPSGHSSFSWAGLLYLSLFLCSKFSIAIPYLPLQPTTADSMTRQRNEHELLPLHQNRGVSGDSNIHDTTGEAALVGKQPAHSPVTIRNYAASPPNYTIILAFFPVAVAIYISSTRYSQFYHHGFDVISGSLIGIATAILAFRWYHLPLSRGQGWAWGPRSVNRAFGIGVGTGGYVDHAEVRNETVRNGDVEAGRV